MNEKIDEALTRFIDMRSEDLSSLDESTMTIAEKIALKIIMDALSEGGQSMKLLVERIGGTPINKNISVIRDEKSVSMISSLEELLGGSRKEAIKEISDGGNHKARNGGSSSRKDSLIPDMPTTLIEAHIEHSDSDNEEDNDEQK